MSEQHPPEIPRDAAYWAKRRLTIEMEELPPETSGLNVKGRHVVGPLQGFGPMWLKTYRIALKGSTVTPQEAIKDWKANFGQFWPKGNNFHAPLTGIEPGEVGILNLPVPGGVVRLSTGVMVLYADDESFAFMTPEGHMFAAFITFSAHKDHEGTTVLQIEPLLRTNDPLWEVAMRVYGFRKEDEFWMTTLRKLAAHFGVYDQEPTLTASLVDPRLQWSQAKNIRHNAAIRSTINTVFSLPRTIWRQFRGKKEPTTEGSLAPNRKTITTTMITVPRDAPYWAEPVSRLHVADVPVGAINLNVNGREVLSPLQGFGQLWQKTYRVHLPGINQTPQEIMAAWKAHFPEFQPADNRFYPPMTGIKPGDVLFIDTLLPAVPNTPGIIPMASGVMVLYADEQSFTVMTPQGFPEAGWNTFSAYEENGTVVAQVQSMARATDPVYELGFRLMGGSVKQEKTWAYVLTQLAAYFGINEPVIEINKTCIDRRIQWRQAKNVWYNAGIRSTLTAPLGRLRRNQA